MVSNSDSKTPNNGTESNLIPATSEEADPVLIAIRTLESERRWHLEQAKLREDALEALRHLRKSGIEIAVPPRTDEAKLDGLHRHKKYDFRKLSMPEALEEIFETRGQLMRPRDVAEILLDNNFKTKLKNPVALANSVRNTLVRYESTKYFRVGKLWGRIGLFYPDLDVLKAKQAATENSYSEGLQDSSLMEENSQSTQQAD